MTGEKYGIMKVNHEIQTHVAAHQLLHKVNHDQCAFCCGTACKLAVDVLGHDVRSLDNYMAKPYGGRLEKKGIRIL